MKMWFIALIFTFCVSLTYAEKLKLTIENYDNPISYKDKEIFYIQMGDDPRFKEVGYDDSAWKTIVVPGEWQKIFTNYDKTCWYRLHIQFPAELPTRELGIHIGKIFDADETYFNGHLIGSRGKIGKPFEHGYDYERIYPIPTKYIRAGEDNVLAVRVYGAYDHKSGFIEGIYLIDSFDNLLWGFFKRGSVGLILIIAYFVISGYFLLFFVRRPKETENLFFGLFTLFLAVYSFFRTEFRYILPFDFNTLKRMEYLALFPIGALFMTFIYRFYKRKDPIVNYIYYGLNIVAIAGIIILPGPNEWGVWNKSFVQYTWLISIVSAFYVLFGEFKRNIDARLMVFSFTLLVGAVINDVLVSRHIIFTPLLLTYGFFFVIVSIALILANRFVRLNNEVEDLNRNLEKKVEERTAEVNTLLEQQNGDYFLTSLLIAPLLVNSTHHENIKVEFYLNQKKKFKFRKWSAQLGGDLCVARSIRLRERDYTVFLNGDAMGKSMQGAGGALVMGVLFNSFVEKTQTDPVLLDLTPKEWLTDFYTQAHTLFESFDGSMLISGIIGMIENKTGLLTYFNSEHPWLTLYRNGKAIFLPDEEQSGKKIGTVGFGSVHILEYPLMSGDVLFAGSDGKDDLLLGYDATSKQRIINEDERLFLRYVEEYDGNTEKIVAALMQKGELTDDLSIVKIIWLGNPSASDFSIESEDKDGLYEKLQSATKLFQSAEYDKAIAELLPLRNSFENPEENFSVLLLLGHCYAKQKKFHTALSVWQSAVELKPNHESLQKNIGIIRKHLGNMA